MLSILQTMKLRLRDAQGLVTATVLTSGRAVIQILISLTPQFMPLTIPLYGL